MMSDPTRQRLAFAIMALLALSAALLGFVGVHRDRARDEANQHAQDALQEAALYRSALEQSSTAIVVVDAYGRIQEWSKGAEKLLGWSRQEALGFGVGFIIPADMRERHRVAFDSMVTQHKIGLIQQISCTALTESGSPVDVLIRITVYERNGLLAAMATINRQSDVKRIKVEEKKK